jgi:hypothetical protein
MVRLPPLAPTAATLVNSTRSRANETIMIKRLVFMELPMPPGKVVK